MSRLAAVAAALLASLTAILTMAYMIGFLADLSFWPATVDRPVGASPGVAAVVDLGLVALFGLQHSLTARQGWKRALARLVPEPFHRSLYLLLSSAALILLILLWQPIGGDVWRLDGDAAVIILYGLFGLGWLLGAACLLLMNPAELFGFAQIADPGRQVPGAFRAPAFYRRIRHPLYLSLLLTFWATPSMSWGHALFATAMSAYILIGIVYEERDLILRFGDEYRHYRERAGMLLPRLRR